MICTREDITRYFENILRGNEFTKFKADDHT